MSQVILSLDQITISVTRGLLAKLQDIGLPIAVFNCFRILTTAVSHTHILKFLDQMRMLWLLCFHCLAWVLNQGSVKAWNSLPYNVVHAPSVQIFKCRLKQHLGM